jgi:2-hydroxy-6-oxonona-2,4-dienedioate hydrolase
MKLRRLFIVVLLLVVVCVVAAGIYVWQNPLAVFAGMNRRALAQAGFTQSRVLAASGQQTVFEAGQGPVLVFLHGAGDHAGAWSKVAPEFTATYRVIIPDLPGHWGSAPGDGPLSIGTVLQGVETVIAARSGGKPVTLIGNSLGGWVAMLYAHKHPERVQRLVVVNGGALRGDRSDLTLMPANREQAGTLMENLMDPGSPQPPGWVLDDIVRQANAGPIARLAKTSVEMDQYLMSDKLQGLHVPVDLLWGDADRLLSLDYARRMLSQLPAARLTAIEHCGHMPQQECPTAFSRKLREILQKAPPEEGPPSAAAIAEKK